MKNKLYIILLSGLLIVSLGGCKTANDKGKPLQDKKADISSEKEEDTETASPQIESGIVIAEKTLNEFCVKIVMDEGIYITDVVSPDANLYEGEFSVVVEKNGRKCHSKELHWNTGEKLYFPEEIKISVKDYNGDGRSDFALGQYLSSNEMEYQFYTVTKQGKVRQLKIDSKGGNSIVAARRDYSPAFKMDNGKVKYEKYNMETGENEKQEVVVR